MNTTAKHSIGLVELPEFGLLNSEGRNWLGHRYDLSVLISKQVLASSLQSLGFDAQIINMTQGDDVVEYGKFIWGGNELTKVYLGKSLERLHPAEYDSWGITNNFSQNREIACLTIKHLASKGRPVVVGGSDAIATPKPYFEAGASAVVLDKSGAANGPIMGYVLGDKPREELSGVLLPELIQPPARVKNRIGPQDWPLPDLSIAKECIGLEYKGLPLPEKEWPMGSIFTDIGCDRDCDFCQTPMYKLGYRAMTPERVLQWANIQKMAGAKAVMLTSDQFLGRILKKGGREEILEIMNDLRSIGLSHLWNNGIELKKMSHGRGIFKRNGNEDLKPDEELVNALFGWNGRVGCYFAYIAAERPIVGQTDYRKLLPWQEHCEMMKAIVRTGVPYLRYGMILGFANDSVEDLKRLEDALWYLYEDLIEINPKLKFQIAPLSLSPIPGTPQAAQVRESGLLEFDDPSIFGSIWTTSVNTYHMNYKEIFDWQKRLTKVGRSRYMEDGVASLGL